MRSTTLLLLLFASLIACETASEIPVDRGPLPEAGLDAGDPGADTAVGDTTPMDAAGPRIVEKSCIGMAVGMPIAFELVTREDLGMQFVAYYNKSRKMTVAARKLGAPGWTTKVLPSVLPWDVHNYVTLELDATNQIHVSGNMHNVPLNYYRTQTALDVATLTKHDNMVGLKGETSVTYPHFMKSPKGELIFKYRQGGSGSGVTYYNIYDHTTQTWSRLLDTPLLGVPGVSAYDDGPLVIGGMYHLTWFWRDKSFSDHDPSYARSADLVNWTKSDGTPLTLPITPANAEVVEPVPGGSGLITYNIRLGADAKDRPVVSYIRYDAAGKTQLYNARLQGGSWKVHQTSSWNDRWEMPPTEPLIFIGPVEVEPDGSLSQTFNHWKEGRGKWRLDPLTLKPTHTDPYPKDAVPPELREVSSTDPNMRVALMYGRGDPHRRYLLRWEVWNSTTKPAQWPPPSELCVVEVAY